MGEARLTPALERALLAIEAGRETRITLRTARRAEALGLIFLSYNSTGRTSSWHVTEAGRAALAGRAKD